ncbi:MAG TPA: hypothetical protein VHZ30_07445 [Verrucomicrobiae bacterium]|nr:hypothetical protein [Verrucomicrobiae bacterium]
MTTADNIRVFPAVRMTDDQFRDLVKKQEHARWRAGLPLQARDMLEDHFVAPPEEIFEITDTMNDTIRHINGNDRFVREHLTALGAAMLALDGLSDSLVRDVPLADLQAARDAAMIAVDRYIASQRGTNC